MTKKLLLAFIALSLFISSSANAEWERLSKTDLGDTYYVDFENIRIEGKIIKHWMFLQYGEPFEGYLSHKTYQKLNCDDYSFMPLRFIYYIDRKGLSRGETQESLIDYWIPTPRNAVAYEAAVILCRKIK